MNFSVLIFHCLLSKISRAIKDKLPVTWQKHVPDDIKRLPRGSRSRSRYRHTIQTHVHDTGLPVRIQNTGLHHEYGTTSELVQDRTITKVPPGTTSDGKCFSRDTHTCSSVDYTNLYGSGGWTSQCSSVNLVISVHWKIWFRVLLCLRFLQASFYVVNGVYSQLR